MEQNVSRPKRHHWVPQFYLRKFATPGSRESDAPKIWRLSKDDLSHDDRPSNILNICVNGYLYAPKDAEGARDWRTEEFLGTAETSASQVWGEIDCSQPNLQDSAIRACMSNFIGLLHLRNYEVFRLIDRTMTLRNSLLGAPSAEAVAALPPDRPDFSDAGRFFAQSLVNNAGRMADTFSEKRWLVLRSDRELFATSDRPVVFLHGRLKMVGPGTAGAIAVLPLSPRRALAMTDKARGGVEGCVDLPAGLGESINKEMLRHCARNVLTGRDPSEVVDELQRDWKIAL